MPRILFCSPTPLTPTLGTSKVYIEASEAFARIGWHTKLVGPEDVADGPIKRSFFELPPHLRQYLMAQGTQYDVIEYEHNMLPYPRRDFPTRSLLVARSVLLNLPHVGVRIPRAPTIRGRIGGLAWGWREHRLRNIFAMQASATMRAADLINVSNTDDVTAAVRHGHPPSKVVVFPFGLFRERFAEFGYDLEAPGEPPVIAFVGTFDARKGMGDIPKLFEAVRRHVPHVRFRLIGTAGLIPSAEGVLRFFRRTDRANIEIFPRYRPEELPNLLRGCSLGVFPSYLEGFPFGVLEMLAAGLPVVAYDAPGPPMMLQPAHLVAPGAVYQMAAKIVEMLRSPATLQALRHEARARAAEFDWERVAAATAAEYLRRLR